MRYDDIRAEILAGTGGTSLPDWAHQILNDVAAGRSPISAVRHPLGFLCLPVQRTGGTGVCLHIWSAAVAPAEITTSPVHCHSWDLISFVLYGTVRNDRAVITEAASDAPATHRVFEVVSRDALDELRATSRTIRCLPGSTSVHRAGQSYALPSGVFHSTSIESGATAATVALGRGVGGLDLSLGPLGGTTHQVRRRRCGPGETTSAALTAARRITAMYAT